MDKKELRRHVRELKRHYQSVQLRAMSVRLMLRVLTHPRLLEARTVALYMAMPDEVETRPLIDALYKKGIRVLLPVVTGPSEMEFRLYAGPESLRRSNMNIEEPAGEAFTDLESIDLIVVPGMAFDAKGHRLGRGRGYYDRKLPLLTRAYKLGLCFPFQLVGEVPVDGNDVAVDEVIG